MVFDDDSDNDNDNNNDNDVDTTSNSIGSANTKIRFVSCTSTGNNVDDKQQVSATEMMKTTTTTTTTTTTKSIDMVESETSITALQIEHDVASQSQLGEETEQGEDTHQEQQQQEDLVQEEIENEKEHHQSAISKDTETTKEIITRQCIQESAEVVSLTDVLLTTVTGDEVQNQPEVATIESVPVPAQGENSIVESAVLLVTTAEAEANADETVRNTVAETESVSVAALAATPAPVLPEVAEKTSTEVALGIFTCTVADTDGGVVSSQDEIITIVDDDESQVDINNAKANIIETGDTEKTSSVLVAENENLPDDNNNEKKQSTTTSTSSTPIKRRKNTQERQLTIVQLQQSIQYMQLQQQLQLQNPWSLAMQQLQSQPSLVGGALSTPMIEQYQLLQLYSQQQQQQLGSMSMPIMYVPIMPNAGMGMTNTNTAMATNLFQKQQQIVQLQYQIQQHQLQQQLQNQLQSPQQQKSASDVAAGAAATSAAVAPNKNGTETTTPNIATTTDTANSTATGSIPWSMPQTVQPNLTNIYHNLVNTNWNNYLQQPSLLLQMQSPLSFTTKYGNNKPTFPNNVKVKKEKEVKQPKVKIVKEPKVKRGQVPAVLKNHQTITTTATTTRNTDEPERSSGNKKRKLNNHKAGPPMFSSDDTTKILQYIQVLKETKQQVTIDQLVQHLQKQQYLQKQQQVQQQESSKDGKELGENEAEKQDNRNKDVTDTHHEGNDKCGEGEEKQVDDKQDPTALKESGVDDSTRKKKKKKSKDDNNDDDNDCKSNASSISTLSDGTAGKLSDEEQQKGKLPIIRHRHVWHFLKRHNIDTTDFIIKKASINNNEQC